MGSTRDAVGCRELTSLLRWIGARAPLGAVLEGGYAPAALAESVEATMAALGGEGEAESVAPDAMLTSRAASHIGRYWQL